MEQNKFNVLFSPFLVNFAHFSMVKFNKIAVPGEKCSNVYCKALKPL